MQRSTQVRDPQREQRILLVTATGIALGSEYAETN